MKEDTKQPKCGHAFYGSLIIAILLSIGYLTAYFIICHFWKEILWEDKDPIRTAFLLAGVVLAVQNMRFVIARIRKTDEQLEKQENQLERQEWQIKESSQANFITALKQGIDMLYSKTHSKQMAGVHYLHSLAKTNKGDKERC